MNQYEQFKNLDFNLFSKRLVTYCNGNFCKNICKIEKEKCNIQNCIKNIQKFLKTEV